MKIRKKRSLTVKEALLWVILAGVAAHTSLWLISEAANNFYTTSVSNLTGNRAELIQ
jgi:hypothetical protein